jgi:hypothetical protein
MAKKVTFPPLDVDSGIEYEIKIKGHLEDHWSDWLGGLEITRDLQGHSLLTGIVPDQAALHGILAQIRDLGLILISLTPRNTTVED